MSSIYDAGIQDECSGRAYWRDYMLVSGITTIQSEEIMRKLGFTDHVKDHWYLCQLVANGISLNITIDKTTGEWEEYILDESFLQPYHYGYILVGDALDELIFKIDSIITKLNDAGLPVRVNHEEYGVNYD